MASSPADKPPASSPDMPVFTLAVISPSVAVPRGLTFSDLSANTNVRQLKERIRQALEAKPSDQAQRLIHRGRLLGSDDETMAEIFGEDALRSAEPLTLHLVLRDLSDARPATNTTMNVPRATPIQGQASGHPQPPIGVSPQPQQQQPHLQQQQQQPHQPIHHHHNHMFPPQPQFRHGPLPFSNLPFGFHHQVPGMQMPPPAPPGTIPGNVPLVHYPQHFAPNFAPNMGQWQATTGDAARLQDIINQNQRERAALGLTGAQDQSGIPRGTPGTHTPSGTASPLPPDGTRTVVREGVGPNGQHWRVTVNETVTSTTPQNFPRIPQPGSPFPAAEMHAQLRPPQGATPRSTPITVNVPPHGGPLSGVDVQNILRTADAIHRNGHNVSPMNLTGIRTNQPTPPGVRTRIVPQQTASGVGTPEPSTTIALGAPGRVQGQTAPATPEVYILSSPEGPRALLMHGNQGAYFTPHNPPVNLPVYQPHWLLGPPFTAPYNLTSSPLPVASSQQTQSWASSAETQGAQQAQHRQPPQAQGQVPQGLPQLPEVRPHVGHGAARPGNVQVRAVVVAQLWPHIWMIIRLMLFIWWFTSPTASWSRWFTVIGVAFTLFIVNTGLLNPLADQVWVPVRRHLENLMPLADNHGRAQPARAANAPAADGRPAEHGQAGELDPADTAARLVQDRRHANASWLMAQARRLERAGILFLASIAPGVAERHIAHLEAEARAERQRQEQAAAAAEEAARAAADNGEGAQDDAVDQGSEPATDGVPARQDEDAPRPQGAEEPLIAI